MSDYLNCAIDMMFLSKACVKDVLAIMERIRRSTPLMKAIWEYSSLAKIRDQKLQRTLEGEQELRLMLATGALTLESSVTPDMQ